MISEERYSELDLVASPLFDFVDSFIDDFDKVWNLKELLFADDPDETLEEFEDLLYNSTARNIYAIYSNMGGAFQQYNENKHEYFLYALFRKYCHDNIIVLPDYNDFIDYYYDHINISPIWNLYRAKELEGNTIISNLRFPYLYASIEDVGEYYHKLFDIANDIMNSLGETPSRKKYLEGILDIYSERLITETNSLLGETDTLENSLTEEEFKNICDVAIPLMEFYKEICKNERFIEVLKEVPGISNSIYASTNFDEIVYVIFTNQICSCYKHLNHFPIDVLSKEGAFIAVWLNIHSTPDLPTFEFFNLAMQQKGVVDALKNTVESMAESVPFSTTDEDSNVISAILSNVDVNLQKKYLVLLYRAASVIAKIDGYISPEESKWLANLLDKTEKLSEELPKLETEAVEDIDYIYQLQELIGLESVKSDVVSLSNFIKMKQMRESKGLKAPQISLHCVFTGNPGTGKTTVARILAGIFKNLGVLKKGHLIETDRSGLVAEYVGQTAVKTNKIIDSALDGVLFIDEAYSLIQGGQNDYGKEAISTLLKRMEDDRERLIVILAGYNEEMQDFINSNPGLRSRFNRYIDFPDYTAEELHKIFNLNVQKNEYTIDTKTECYIKYRLEDVVKNKTNDFGNARFIRNLFERAIENQANRLSAEMNISLDKLSAIEIEDIQNEF